MSRLQTAEECVCEEVGKGVCRFMSREYARW